MTFAVRRNHVREIFYRSCERGDIDLPHLMEDQAQIRVRAGSWLDYSSFSALILFTSTSRQRELSIRIGPRYLDNFAAQCAKERVDVAP